MYLTDFNVNKIVKNGVNTNQTKWRLYVVVAVDFFYLGTLIRNVFLFFCLLRFFPLSLI